MARKNSKQNVFSDVKMGKAAAGFEPANNGFANRSGPLKTKDLGDDLSSYLSEDLPQTLKKHPELLQMIKAWPEISSVLQQAILRMIEGA